MAFEWRSRAGTYQEPLDQIPLPRALLTDVLKQSVKDCRKLLRGRAPSHWFSSTWPGEAQRGGLCSPARIWWTVRRLFFLGSGTKGTAYLSGEMPVVVGRGGALHRVAVRMRST